LKLSIRGVSKHFTSRGRVTQALAPVDLELAQGEFVSLVGPSGCGKSTLLHIVGGLEGASAGSVELDGERVRGPGAELGLVFQQHTLFPWLTVLENVRFPYTLSRRRTRDAEQRARRDELVFELLQSVGLWDFRQALPAELSGGMQQRAAIARALVSHPDVLLMDEPFGALDAQTREEMQELLLRIIDRHRTTTLFVTHDVDEALLLSDRVVLFSSRPGRVLLELGVELPRRQRSAELKHEPEFLRLRRELLARLKQAVHDARSAADSMPAANLLGGER
jgi:NitT/TauT family transport system ATP-binding protein